MKNVTIGRWILGVFFILGALGMLLQFQILAAICSIGIGLLLSPPSCQAIMQASEKRLGFKLPQAVPIVLGVVLLLILSSLDLTTNSTVQTNNETSPAVVDVWQTAIESSKKSIETFTQANSSNTIEDWQSAVTALENTVDQFKSIPSDHPGYAEAQTQITAYSGSLEQAQQRLEHAQQRLAKQQEEESQAAIEDVILRNPENGNSVLMQFKCPDAVGTLAEKVVWEPSELAKAVCNGQTEFGGLQLEKVAPDNATAAPQSSPTPTPQPSPTPTPTPIPEPIGSRPIRQPVSGSCQCPYDTDSAGRSCGKRSAYSKPSGERPRCYTDD